MVYITSLSDTAVVTAPGVGVDMMDSGQLVPCLDLQDLEILEIPVS